MPHPRIRTNSARLPWLHGTERAAALAALLAAGAIGCSTSSSQPLSAHAPAATTTARPLLGGPSASGRPTGTPSSGSVVVLDEHAAGSTVQVGVGTTIEVDLHSTYWSIPHNSAPHLLEQSGAPSIHKGTNCHPGFGCGTVQARFLARQAGTATLTSERTSCGEAVACPPSGRTFTVTVRMVMAG